MLTLFRALVGLYPAAFRREYGTEMMSVLSEVQAEIERESFWIRAVCEMREIGGLLRGALEEHMRSITGSYEGEMFLPRRITMQREFRFPKATVALMTIILAAVIMTAPGTILIAKLLVPETEKPLTAGRVEMAEIERETNALGAIARGTIDGLHLALNVAAMLVSFIALIYMVDAVFGGVHNLLAAHGMGHFPSSLEQIFGWIFAPIAWLAGVPWQDCSTVGNLMGLRMVTNELVAFQRLGPMQQILAPRSFTIATFALCGFANFSSIGIQIGGIGALAPNKKSELARLGIRAMLAGTMANLMSASIVGIMLR